MKETFKSVLMVGIAIAVGVAAVYAATDSIFEATDENTTYTDDETALIRKGLFLGDHTTKSNNHEIRMWNGTDAIFMGKGTDILHFWEGQDAITFGNVDNSSAAITFDAAGSGIATAFDDSEVFIRADTPDTAPKITICSEDVVVQLGRVIEQ